MKKLLFPLAFAVALASCSEAVETLNEDLNQTPGTYSKYRSVTDALQIADNVLSAGNVGARSGAKLKNAACAHVILGDQARSGEADTLLYALDIENDGGFVLVAAPKEVEPIMAIIDSGSYADSDNQNNEAYQQTLNLIKNYVSANGLIGGGQIPDRPLPPIFQLVEYYDTVKVNRVHEPAVEVAWNQGWPENIYAPNNIAGCVPVAIAQTLATMEKPSNITYTFPDRDIDSEILDWKEIKKHKRSANYYWCDDCSASQAVHNTIGRVIREIGHLANASYLETATSVVTGAYIEEIVYKFANVKPYKKHGTLTSLFYDIDGSGGMAIVDYRLMDNHVEGHAFIADGTRNIEYTIVRHYLEDPSSKDYITEIIRSEKTNLIHYNWGWGGSCNGWFNLNAVQPGNAVEYDHFYEYNASGYEFDKNTILYWYYKI